MNNPYRKISLYTSNTNPSFHTGNNVIYNYNSNNSSQNVQTELLRTIKPIHHIEMQNQWQLLNRQVLLP